MEVCLIYSMLCDNAIIYSHYQLKPTNKINTRIKTGPSNNSHITKLKTFINVSHCLNLKVKRTGVSLEIDLIHGRYTPSVADPGFLEGATTLKVIFGQSLSKTVWKCKILKRERRVSSLAPLDSTICPCAEMTNITNSGDELK